MRRSEYLRLREIQQDLSAGVARWDTASFTRLKALEELLVRRVATESAEWTAGGTPHPRPEAELRSRMAQSREMLGYLRALCYLRQHGISPSWPLGASRQLSVEAETRR
jgi:hypothetical protein